MVIIFLIILVLFGAGKLPQVFESFGKGMKSFRDAQKEEDTIEVAQAQKAIDENSVDEAEEIVDVATAKTEV
jgi:sec-independent protein translocase protein TatA